MEEIMSERFEIDDFHSYDLYRYWARLVNYIAEHPEEAISYIRRPCSADEFVNLSEVMDEVLNERVVNAYKELFEVYPEECKKYNVKECL